MRRQKLQQARVPRHSIKQNSPQGVWRQCEEPSTTFKQIEKVKIDQDESPDEEGYNLERMHARPSCDAINRFASSHFMSSAAFYPPFPPSLSKIHFPQGNITRLPSGIILNAHIFKHCDRNAHSEKPFWDNFSGNCIISHLMNPPTPPHHQAESSPLVHS